MSKMINLEGVVFNRLTVLSINSKDGRGRYLWDCVCICGNKATVSSDNLRRRHTTSCGCLQRETAERVFVKHGNNRKGKTTPEYRAWAHLKTRCYNEKCDMYYAYGGRGITVCDRWLNSFENFLADMGNRPVGNYSIDRIDTNKGYYPKNCKWSTALEQSRNKRNNHWIEFMGRRMIIQDWVKILKTTDKVIRRRISSGVDIDFNMKTKKHTL